MAERRIRKLTKGAKIEIFVASNSSDPCLPPTVLMVPDQIRCKKIQSFFYSRIFSNIQNR